MGNCSTQYTGLAREVYNQLVKNGVKDTKILSTSIEMVTAVNYVMERLYPNLASADKSFWVDYIKGDTKDAKIRTLAWRLQIISREMPGSIRDLLVNRKLVITKPLAIAPWDPLTTTLIMAADQVAKEGGSISSFDAEFLAPIQYNKEQLEAINNCYEWCVSNPDSNSYYTIQGQAGTGKTTIIKEVVYRVMKKLMKENGGELPLGFTISCATVSNEAASVLRNSMSVLAEKIQWTTGKMNCMSLASLKGETIHFENGIETFYRNDDSKSTPPIEESDIIIIDECSMITQEQVDYILNNATKKGRIVIFMGDSGQVEPIETPDETSPTFNNKNISKLTKRERQRENKANGSQPLLELSDAFWNIAMGKSAENPGNIKLSTAVNEKQTGAVIPCKVSIMEAVANEGKGWSGLPDVDVRANWINLFVNAMDTGDPMFVQMVAGTNKRVREINEDVHKDMLACYFDDNAGKRVEENKYTGFFNREIVRSYSNLPVLNNSEKAIVVSQEEVGYNPLHEYSPLVKFMKITLQKSDGRYVNVLFPYIKDEKTGKIIRGIDVIKPINDSLSDKNKYRFNNILMKNNIISDLQYGYCCTVHKAQGSTYDNVIVWRNSFDYQLYNNRQRSYARQMYTALTRASKIAIVVDMNAESRNGNYDISGLLEKYDKLVMSDGKRIMTQAGIEDASKFEVSTLADKGKQGDSRFSAHNARFKPGTVIFGHDVSGRTIESVYQHGIKQGDWTTDDNEKTGVPNTKRIKVEVHNGFWTRSEVESNNDKVFLFGDNTDDRLNTHHIPTSTQAVIRGLPNAIGIDTKKDRGTSPSSYFSDSDFEQFKNQIDEAIAKAIASGKTIVVPADGIGTDKAMLKEKSPKCFEYLQKKLSELKEESPIIVGNTEDDSYKQGYLPLWTIWAIQNPDLIEELRQKSEGKTLVDSLATTKVSQARALTDILKWTKKDNASPVSKEVSKELSEYVEKLQNVTEKHREMVRLLGNNKEAVDAIATVIKALKQGENFDKVKSFFTEEEQDEIKKGLNGGHLKVATISKHTDPAFFAQQVVEELEKNAEKPLSDPTRIVAGSIWTKHDGLPIIKILEACKKYRVAPIMSFSITGLGGTTFEPGVMKYNDLLDRIEKLIKKGLVDPSTTTIRIDPILPGVTNMEDVRRIVKRCKSMGIKKFVTSVMQSYGQYENTPSTRHIIRNINNAHRAMFGTDYDWEKYYGYKNGHVEHVAKENYAKEIADVFVELNKDSDITIQSCASKLNGIEMSQCLDPYIIENVTGIETDKGYKTDERPDCKCYGGQYGDMFRFDEQYWSSCSYCYAANDAIESIKYYDDNGRLINNEFTATDEMELGNDGLNTILSDFTIHSGGAIGVDSMFDNALSKYGVTSNQYYIGKKTPTGNFEITDPKLIEEGVNHAKLASEKIRSEGHWEREEERGHTNLLARDWIQVKNSDTIIAISRIDSRGDVTGGTGFAVEMAKQYNANAGTYSSKKKIYCYDLDRHCWFQYTTPKLYSKKTGKYFYAGDKELKWIPVPTPILSKNTACIGTREAHTHENTRKEAQSAIDAVVSKTLAHKLSYYRIDDAEMSFDYENNKRSDVSSLDTLTAIINGERTSTTRHKYIEFWQGLKKGDIVKLYKEKDSGKYVYIRITEPLRELTEDYDAEDWSKTEGWSVDYYNRRVRPLINSSTKPYIIKYEFVATNIENDVNRLKGFLEKHSDIFGANENHVVTTQNLGSSEFTISNEALAQDMLKNGEIVVESREAADTLIFAEPGDLFRIVGKDMIYTATIESAEKQENGAIFMRFSNINAVVYDESLKESYEKLNSYMDVKKIPYKVEHKASAKNQLGSELYRKRVRYVNARLSFFIRTIMKMAVDSGDIDKGDYKEMFKHRPISDFKDGIIDKFEKEISDTEGLLSEAELAKQIETYRKYNLFSNEEDLKNYVREVSKNKIEANKFILAKDRNGEYLYFNEMFFDALSLWARNHNFTLAPNSKGKIENGEQKAEGETETNQPNNDNIIDEEYDHKLNWQVEHRKMTDSTSVEFKEWLSNIALRDKEGKLIFDDIGEIERYDEDKIFNDLKDVLSRDCFTLSDMMAKIESFSETKPEYGTLVKQLKMAKYAHFRTDMFRLFNVERINYNVLYIKENGVDEYGEREEGVMIMENQNIDNEFDVTGSFKKLVKTNENKISLLGTAEKAMCTLSWGEYQDQASSFQIRLVYIENKKIWIENALSAGINFRQSILNDNNDRVSELANSILVGLRCIGYDISKEEVDSALLNITPEHPYPIVDIASSLYDVFTQLKRANNMEEALKMPATAAVIKKIMKLVPKQDGSLTKTGTVYANNHQYPKYKFISHIGLLLKHLHDSNPERYAQFLQDSFKQYDWFYSEGNYKKMFRLFSEAQNSLKFKEGITPEQKAADYPYSHIFPGFSYEQAMFEDILGLLKEMQKTIDTDKIAANVGIINDKMKRIPNVAKQLNDFIVQNDSSKVYADEEKFIACLVEAPRWKNSVLKGIFETQDRMSIQREQVLTYDGKDYFDMTSDDIALISLHKYFASRRNGFTKFLMPNYADAGVLEYISLPNIRGDRQGKKKLVDEIYNQERERIVFFEERKRWRHAVYDAYNICKDFINHERSTTKVKDTVIQACIDDFMEFYERTGVMKNYTQNYYYSYPIQNVEDVDDINMDDNGKLIVKDKPKIIGNGMKFNFLNFISNNNDYSDETLSNEIKKEAVRLAKISYKYKQRFNTKYTELDNQNLYYYVSSEELTNVIDNEVEGLDYFKESIDGATVYLKPIDEMYDFVMDYMIAKTAIIQMTVGDLANFKNAVDFQKRFKQVYAGTNRLNTETFEAYDTKGQVVRFNEYARQEMTYIDINDVYVDRSMFITELMRGYKVAGYDETTSSEILKYLASEYKNVNTADGQTFCSLSSLRAMMSMADQWEPQHQKLFKKLIVGKPLDKRDLKIFLNPRKPFMSFYICVTDKATGKKIKKLIQIKNSEFLLLNLYNQTRNNRNTDDSILFALNKFMEDNGIDKINFESTIKVGGQGAIDIVQLAGPLGVQIVNKRDYENEDDYHEALKHAITVYYNSQNQDKKPANDIKLNEELYDKIFQAEKAKKSERLINALYNITGIRKSQGQETYEEQHRRVKESCNPEIVKTTPYSNYGIISEEHEHYMDRKQKLGTQLMRLLTSNNEGSYNINGKTYNNNQIFVLVSKLITAKGLLHTEKLSELFGNEKALTDKILMSMMNDSKYSEATMEAAMSTNENGRLNMLGDTVIKDRVEALLNSFVRNEINKIELDGGTCTQVTAMFSDDLHIVKGRDENGNVYIKHWQVIAPLPFKSLLTRYMDKNGMLDINKFMADDEIDNLTKEKILKVLGCRVPTESKHSIQHMQIVGFSAPNNGSIVMLPYEITVTSGSDFDIDHMYMWRYSFELIEKTTINDKGKEEKYKIPKFIDYRNSDGHMMPIEEMTEEQINNALIDAFWSVLESPNNFVQELTPNGYENTKHSAYMAYIMGNDDAFNVAKEMAEEKMGDDEFNKFDWSSESSVRQYVFSMLKSMNNKQLEKIVESSINRLSLSNELYFFRQNSFGKGQLGTMAVNNVFLSLLQHTNISVDSKFRVTLNGYSNDSFNKIRINDNMSKGLTSDMIMELLGAAPDSAKDPMLIFLGANNLTTNAILAAALLGYDTESISLLFNNQHLTKFLSSMFRDNEFINENKLKDRLIDYILSQNGINSERIKEIVEDNQSKGYAVLYSDNNCIITVDNDGVDINFTNNAATLMTNDLLLPFSPRSLVQTKIFAAFYNFFKVGQDMFDLSMVTRADSTSGAAGASVANVIYKILKINAVTEKSKKGLSSLIGISQLYKKVSIPLGINLKNKKIKKYLIDEIGESPLGHVQAQITLGLEQAYHYYRGRITEFCPTLMNCYAVLSKMVPSLAIREDLIKKLVADFINYKLSTLEFFGDQTFEVDGSPRKIDIKTKAEYVINNMWRDINTVKTLYPEYTNNAMLKLLEVNDKGVVIIPDVGSYEYDAKDQISDAWEELINSRYDMVKKLGYNLIRYSFYRNTMKFAPDGFGHLCPNIRKSIPGYAKAIEDSYSDDNSFVSFLSQFIKNNYDLFENSATINDAQVAGIDGNELTYISNVSTLKLSKRIRLKKNQIKIETNIKKNENESKKDNEQNNKQNKSTNNEFVIYEQSDKKPIPVFDEKSQEMYSKVYKLLDDILFANPQNIIDEDREWKDYQDFSRENTCI